MIVRPSRLSMEEKEEVLKRLWKKDPSLWSQDPLIQKNIVNRLGWLDVLPKMKNNLTEIIDFSKDIKEEGFSKVVLLGMGGSSLCPLVMSKIFGNQKGWPKLVVLDTTDPDVIEEAVSDDEIEKCFFIFASKSGTTIEPNTQFAYFWEKLKKSVKKPGEHFAAITDPGTPLDVLAREKGFRKCFLNPPDIGGRYSALSYFGLVPASLLGIDINKILEKAEKMIASCGPDVPIDKNPGFILGEFLGEMAAQSKDKLSFLADPDIEPFGLWLEQLIAESSGKETLGIVPVVGESPGIPGFYGGDRIFVYLRTSGELDDFVKELKEAEFPLMVFDIEDYYDLGGEFFRWEMATALACHFLGVNAFDEPNVKLAKEKTKEIVEIYVKEKKMPITFWVDPQSQINFRASRMLASSMKSLSRTLRDLFLVLPSWGYLAFLPYLPYDKDVEEIITDMRKLVRQEKGCSTTMGFGPRYLHSTGQLHKGGVMSSAFIIFTRRRKKEYPEIPGYGLSFWHLQFAQAVGDFQALSEAKRRVLHIHLPVEFKLGLESFSKVLSRACRL